MTIRRLALLIVVMLIAALAAYAVTPPGGERSMRRFDPARMASLETGMWQAYYAKQRVALFRGLVTMLHEQYHYSWARAARDGFYLARAAARFGELRDRDDTVLPDLERAYTDARDWTHAHFDPAAVARAELAWWVARRLPGQDSVDHVGRLMADEYALLYDVPIERVANAALLRAEAGRLRDDTARQPDWREIERLLLDAYRSLLVGINGERYAYTASLPDHNAS
jgi:hypothetical protein